MTAVYMVCRWPLKRKGFRRHGGIEEAATSSNVVFDPFLAFRVAGDLWDV